MVLNPLSSEVPLFSTLRQPFKRILQLISFSFYSQVNIKIEKKSEHKGSGGKKAGEKQGL